MTKEAFPYQEKPITYSVKELGLLLLSLPFTALSYNQREAIKKRDGHCRAPFRHKCNGWGINKKLNVHHISTQRFEEFQGIAEEERDRPENVITICTNAHDMIHPDNESMRRAFAQHDEFKKDQIFKYREDLARQGIQYWNSKWDGAMKSIVKRLTVDAIKKGWVYPDVNHRNGNH